jgi:hypothetical protein
MWKLASNSEGLTTPCHKNLLVMKYYTGPWNLEGSWEYDAEPSGYIKGVQFLDWLSDC